MKNHILTTKAVDDVLGKAGAGGCDVLVLSQGWGNRTGQREGDLKTPEDVLAHAKAKGVEVIQMNSKECAPKYKQLVQAGKRVCMLLHATC